MKYYIRKTHGYSLNNLIMLAFGVLVIAWAGLIHPVICGVGIAFCLYSLFPHTPKCGYCKLPVSPNERGCPRCHNHFSN